MPTTPNLPAVSLRVRRTDGEWAVQYWADGVRSEARTYYASDRQDALATAAAMARDLVRLGHAVEVV